MSNNPVAVALEGASGAGKTTLSRNLKTSLSQLRVIVLPDYSVSAGGPEYLPRAPAETVEEELSALSFLLDLDHWRRQQGHISAGDVDLIVMDRSVHTLLAHRFATAKLLGLDVFAASCKLAAAHARITWPNLILYVDTPQEILNSRQSPESPPPEARIFVDPHYNELFRSYFIPALRYTTTPTVVIDGRQSTDAVQSAALAAIQALLTR